MEIEREAICAYIAKYHFEQFDQLYMRFKMLPTNVVLTNDKRRAKPMNEKQVALIDKVKQKIEELQVGKSGYSAFWQDQEHLRRMNRMADATNVTPKILMEQIKDYNWTVDEILEGAPAYEKKQADQKDKNKISTEISVKDVPENQ